MARARGSSGRRSRGGTPKRRTAADAADDEQGGADRESEATERLNREAIERIRSRLRRKYH
jgi:hypothetical protein